MRVGDSMRSTSAPMSASSSEANGPGSRVEKSSTLSDANGPCMCPLLLIDRQRVGSRKHCNNYHNAQPD